MRPTRCSAFRCSAFLAGDRNFTVLFEPGERRALEGFFWSDGQLVLSILDELQPVFEVLTPSTAGWTRRSSPACRRSASSMSGASTSRRPRATATCSPTRRTRSRRSSLTLIEPGKSPVLLKRAPRTFTADGLVVTAARSGLDRRRAHPLRPGRPGRRDRRRAGHLTGYGGFGVSSVPYYNSAIGKLWLERGGTSVTGQHPRRRRVRHALARCRPPRRQAPVA